MKNTKTICFHVEEELLRAIRIQAARSGCSVQEYIGNLIRKDLHPEEQSELTPEQMRELHSLAEQMLEAMEQMQNMLRPETTEQTFRGGMTLG